MKKHRRLYRALLPWATFAAFVGCSSEPFTSREDETDGWAAFALSQVGPDGFTYCLTGTVNFWPEAGGGVPAVETVTDCSHATRNTLLLPGGYQVDLDPDYTCTVSPNNPDFLGTCTFNPGATPEDPDEQPIPIRITGSQTTLVKIPVAFDFRGQSATTVVLEVGDGALVVDSSQVLFCDRECPDGTVCLIVQGVEGCFYPCTPVITNNTHQDDCPASDYYCFTVQDDGAAGSSGEGGDAGSSGSGGSGLNELNGICIPTEGGSGGAGGEGGNAGAAGNAGSSGDGGMSGNGGSGGDGGASGDGGDAGAAGDAGSGGAGGEGGNAGAAGNAGSSGDGGMAGSGGEGGGTVECNFDIDCSPQVCVDNVCVDDTPTGGTTGTGGTSTGGSSGGTGTTTLEEVEIRYVRPSGFPEPVEVLAKGFVPGYADNNFIDLCNSNNPDVHRLVRNGNEWSCTRQLPSTWIDGNYNAVYRVASQNASLLPSGVEVQDYCWQPGSPGVCSSDCYEFFGWLYINDILMNDPSCRHPNGLTIGGCNVTPSDCE